MNPWQRMYWIVHWLARANDCLLEAEKWLPGNAKNPENLAIPGRVETA